MVKYDEKISAKKIFLKKTIFLNINILYMFTAATSWIQMVWNHIIKNTVKFKFIFLFNLINNI